MLWFVALLALLLLYFACGRHLDLMLIILGGFLAYAAIGICASGLDAWLMALWLKPLMQIVVFGFIVGPIKLLVIKKMREGRLKRLLLFHLWDEHSTTTIFHRADAWLWAKSVAAFQYLFRRDRRHKPLHIRIR